MTDPILFALGLVITIITVTALVLVGRGEAQDPAFKQAGSASDG